MLWARVPNAAKRARPSKVKREWAPERVTIVRAENFPSAWYAAGPVWPAELVHYVVIDGFCPAELRAIMQPVVGTHSMEQWLTWWCELKYLARYNGVRGARNENTRVPIAEPWRPYIAPRKVSGWAAPRWDPWYAEVTRCTAYFYDLTSRRSSSYSACRLPVVSERAEDIMKQYDWAVPFVPAQQMRDLIARRTAK